MNEQVLEAIIRLLAKVVMIDGVARPEERVVIKSFLLDYLNDKQAEKYLCYYDILIESEAKDLEDVSEIVHELNKELNEQQKIIILVHVIEVIIADYLFTKEEEDFIQIIAKEFHISDHQFSEIKLFLVTEKVFYKKTSRNIVIIGNERENESLRGNYHCHPGLKSHLAILRLPNIEMYLLRLQGEDQIQLNGMALKPKQTYPFTIGSSVKGDKIDPLHYSDVVSYYLKGSDFSRISFEAKSIRYYFPGGRKGLHSINIKEESGNLVAIMGASGSGKSTLLNVLNGNLLPQLGSVKINGLDIYYEQEQVQGVIGYVPQDDLLIEELTVYENLFFAAQLCFGKASEETIDKLVLKTLRNLGLYEARDLKVGNSLDKSISGGQRKRLNIGLELLRQPAVLFLDEPTSGLSSKDSENILDLLRELTFYGKLIFVVIHQPSSDIFKMFDKLIILDVGGYQIYYGNPVESLVYFKTQANQIDKEDGACLTCGNVQVEEVFNIIENEVLDEYGKPTKERKIVPSKWHEIFQKNVRLPQSNTVSIQLPNTLDIPSHWQQFKVFVKRDVLAKVNNRQYLIINLLQAPLLALILSLVVRFYHVDELTGNGEYVFSENINLPAYLFMSTIISLFMGLTISAEEIIKDAKIRKREAFLELSRGSYLNSKVFILFTISAVQSLIYILIGNWIMGIQGMNMIYWLILFSSFCFANMLGLNISATFNSVITVYIIIPLLLIPQLLLGGIVVKFDEMNPSIANDEGNVPSMGNIMASRWAFEALAVSQFMYNPFEKEFYEYDQHKAIAEYKKTYYIPTLKSKLESCISEKNKHQEDRFDFKEYLSILNNEIHREMEITPNIQLDVVDSLAPEYFNTEIANKTKVYLAALRKHYVRKFNNADREKNNMVFNLIEKRGKDEYIESKRKYHNDNLVTLVTNKGTEKRIIEYKDRLIQKVYPIFLEPSNQENIFDYHAHFYAPTKHFFGTNIPTLFFNVIVMWGLSIILYITLYFNTFKAVIEGFSLFPRAYRAIKNRMEKIEK